MDMNPSINPCVGDKYIVDLAVSYAPFVRATNTSEVSNEMIQGWMNSTRDHYNYVATPEELMTFFKIDDSSENRQWIEKRHYNISGLIKSQDTVKKSIMFHYVLEVRDHGILLS